MPFWRIYVNGDNKKTKPSSEVPNSFARFQKQPGFVRQIFIKISNINSHGNPSRGRRADTRGQGDRQTDKTT